MFTIYLPPLPTSPPRNASSVPADPSDLPDIPWDLQGQRWKGGISKDFLTCCRKVRNFFISVLLAGPSSFPPRNQPSKTAVSRVTCRCCIGSQICKTCGICWCCSTQVISWLYSFWHCWNLFFRCEESSLRIQNWFGKASQAALKRSQTTEQVSCVSVGVTFRLHLLSVSLKGTLL